MEEITNAYTDVDEAISDLNFIADLKIGTAVLIESPDNEGGNGVDWRELSEEGQVELFRSLGFCSCHAPTMKEVEEMSAPVIASLDKNQVAYTIKDYHHSVPEKIEQHLRIILGANLAGK